MNPDNVTPETRIEHEYHYQLFRLEGPRDFEDFLKRWSYWLEPNARGVDGELWSLVFSLLMQPNFMTFIYMHQTMSNEEPDPISNVLVPPKIFKLFKERHKETRLETTGALYLEKKANNTLGVWS